LRNIGTKLAHHGSESMMMHNCQTTQIYGEKKKKKKKKKDTTPGPGGRQKIRTRCHFVFLSLGNTTFKVTSFSNIHMLKKSFIYSNLEKLPFPSLYRGSFSFSFFFLFLISLYIGVLLEIEKENDFKK
jgi:hypothetical protein